MSAQRLPKACTQREAWKEEGDSWGKGESSGVRRGKEKLTEVNDHNSGYTCQIGKRKKKTKI